MRSQLFIGISLLGIIFCALLSTSLASQKHRYDDIEAIGARNINAGQINFYSLEREVNLGRELAAEFESRIRLLDDPEVTEYISRLGQKLVRNSDAKVPLVIKVVD